MKGMEKNKMSLSTRRHPIVHTNPRRYYNFTKKYKEEWR
jgi:hypothetical protein